MGLIESEAFVLNGFRYGESSKIITLYSKNSGKFNAIVKGVRNVKARQSGVYENMNLINVFLNKKDSRSLQVIGKAEILNSFKGIKSDLDKLAIGYNIIEIINKTSEEYDISHNAFYLLKNVFDFLEKSKTNFGFILLYFMYKLSYVLGLDFLSYVTNGTFVKDKSYKISEKHIDCLMDFREKEIEETEYGIISDAEIKYLIKAITDFYTINYNKLNFLKSNNFLNEILNM